MTDFPVTIIYGTGAAAEALLDRHGSAWHDIIFVTTTGEGEFHGKPVLAARDISRMTAPRIIVASSFRRQILDVLEELGISDDCVTWYLPSEDKIVSTSELRDWFTHQPADYQVVMAQQEVMAGCRDMVPEFFPLLNFVKPFTMTSVPRLYDLYETIRYLVRAKIPGDIIECGVWRGGSMMLAAKTLLALGETDRDLVLFDTYAGHPRPDPERDVDLWGNRAINDWVIYSHADGTSAWGEVSIEEVAVNLTSTGYPTDKIHLIKGMVEDTAPANPRDSIALLRLDTDWYSSTKVALETFWPRVSRGGVLIADDYGHYQGQREAIDNFFVDRPILLHRIDYACRAAVKTD